MVAEFGKRSEGRFVPAEAVLADFSIDFRSQIFPSYTSDGNFESAKGSAGAEGDRYWNSTDKIVREHDGTSWRDQQAGVALPGVEHFTADDTLTNAEAGKICTNKGATAAVVIKLPASSPVGTTFGFVLLANYKLTIAVNTGDKFYHGRGTYYYGGTAYSETPGCALSVVKVDSDKWTVYRHFDNSPAGITGWESETKVISTQDVIPDLDETPYLEKAVQLYVGGVRQQNTVDYDVNGKSFTWNAVGNQHVPVGASVWAEYPTGIGVDGGWTFIGAVAELGFFGGGYTGSSSDVIDYIDPNVLSGNATNRGDLSIDRYGLCGLVGPTYGFFCGGRNSGGNSNVIDYLNRTVSTGDASDRGDLTVARRWLGPVSGPKYGFCAGGNPSPVNVIDYIDMTVTSGNASDRGNLTLAAYGLAGVQGELANNTVYGFLASGKSGSYNKIEYINAEIVSGNATDRGDLSVARYDLAGLSGPYHGFYCGGLNGTPGTDVIDYISYSTTTANALDRGDLAYTRDQHAGVNSGGTSGEYGFLGGGRSDHDPGPPSITTRITYLDLTLTTGADSHRGNLTVGRKWLGGI